MVSISKSSSPCTNPLVTVPRAQITIAILVNFNVPHFFQFPSKVEVLIPLFSFFQFYSVVSRDNKVHKFSLLLLLFITHLSFSHQRHLMVFHWSLSDSKSPQVSRTLLSILAVFNNAVVWMVSTQSLTSKSSRPFNNPLVTVPKAPITIGIIVTFMFHNFFFNSLARSRYLSLFSHSFSFILCCLAGSKVDNFTDFLFFVDYYKIWSSG